MSWPCSPVTEPVVEKCLCLVEGLRSRRTNDTGNDHPIILAIVFC